MFSQNFPAKFKPRRIKKDTEEGNEGRDSLSAGVVMNAVKHRKCCIEMVIGLSGRFFVYSFVFYLFSPRYGD